MSEVKTASDHIRYLARILIENPDDPTALNELALISKRTQAEVSLLTLEKGVNDYSLVFKNKEGEKMAWTEESSRGPSTYVNWHPFGPFRDLDVALAFGAAIIECALFVKANKAKKDSEAK